MDGEISIFVANHVLPLTLLHMMKRGEGFWVFWIYHLLLRMHATMDGSFILLPFVYNIIVVTINALLSSAVIFAYSCTYYKVLSVFWICCSSGDLEWSGAGGSSKSLVVGRESSFPYPGIQVRASPLPGGALASIYCRFIFNQLQPFSPDI